MLMVGLDAAGKTTIAYRWARGEVITTIPTIGFNVEECYCDDFSLTLWDVGGKDKIRPLWRHYYAGAHALIYVVDSGDHDRIDDVRTELTRMLCEEILQSLDLLVIANKQDLPNAMPLDVIAERLDLHRLQDRHWHILPASATTREGLQEAKDWIIDALRGVPHNCVVGTLHVARSPQVSGVLISCTGMGGNELASITLQEAELQQLTAADLRSRLAERIGQPPNRLRLVLPCGRLLEDGVARGKGGNQNGEPLLKALGLEEKQTGCSIS